MKKNKFFVLFVVLFFAFWGATIFAQTTTSSDRPLEVKYPSFPQVTPPTTVATPVTEYVKYLYYFFIFTAGFFALGSLVYASFRYVTSAGSPEAMKDARDQISAALLGVLILVSSWIILNQINPELVVFKLNPLKESVPPQLSGGIMLCKKAAPIGGYWSEQEKAEKIPKENQEEIKAAQKKLNDYLKEILDQCFPVTGRGDLSDTWDNQIKQNQGYVYLIPSKKGSELTNYGIFLFEDKNYDGAVHIVYTADLIEQPTESQVTIKDVSSIKPFRVVSKPDSEWEVTSYEEVNMNKGFAPDEKKSQTFPKDCQDKGEYWCFSKLDTSPRSIEIKGKYIAVLSKSGTQDSWRYESAVFDASQDNLLQQWYEQRGIVEICPDTIIGYDPEGKPMTGKGVREYCPIAEAIFIISGEIF